MPQLSGIYDSAWVQPVARIKENLSIWSLKKWNHYIIDFLEPIPPSSQSTVEMVTASGATSLAAGGTIAKQVAAILQLNELEFTHLRWEPLDNVEGVLWELAGQARFSTRSFHARVNRNTRLWDPHLVTTTFWVLGINRDMNLEVRNPMLYATPVARFRFWGYRYILVPWNFSGLLFDEQRKLEQGDLETVRTRIGVTTWLPAEGRAS